MSRQGVSPMKGRRKPDAGCRDSISKVESYLSRAGREGRSERATHTTAAAPGTPRPALAARRDLASGSMAKLAPLLGGMLPSEDEDRFEGRVGAGAEVGDEEKDDASATRFEGGRLRARNAAREDLASMLAKTGEKEMEERWEGDGRAGPGPISGRSSKGRGERAANAGRPCSPRGMPPVLSRANQARHVAQSFPPTHRIIVSALIPA